MNAELRQADERFEVVRAAEGWREAGAIDDSELATIRSRFADDRRRTRPAFRVLFFVLTLITGQAVWGFSVALFGVLLFTDGGSGGALRHATLLALLAAVFGLAARFAIEQQKLRRFGIEEGLVVLAIGFELGAFALTLHELGVPDRGVAFGLGWNLAIFAGVAAGRWGLAGQGFFCGIGLFGALSLLPGSRLLWIGAALVLIALTHWISALERAAVAHRRRADELRVVALVALYFACHVSVAIGLLFDATSRWRIDPSRAAPDSTLWRTDAALALGWFALFAIPVALVVAGLRRRDRIDLALGAIGLLASAATALDALDVLDWCPAWLLFAGGGLLLLAIAFAVRAALRRAPERTLAGWTDAPLYEPDAGRSDLELAAALATFTPAARRPDSPPDFEPGGGSFGGGGASTKF